MEIKTKFDVLDGVYFIEKNTVNKARIKAIYTEVYTKPHNIIKTDILYKFGWTSKPEEKVFKTKESLLKSL